MRFTSGKVKFVAVDEGVLVVGERFRRSVSSVRKMYEAFLVRNSMSDGTLAYPLVSEKGRYQSKMACLLKRSM